MAISSPPAEGTEEEGRGLRSAIRNGAIGGLLATVTMTVYRLPITRSLPPTAAFWAQYGPGDRTEAGPVTALLLHLGYGTGAGVAFGAAFATAVPGMDSDASRELTSLAVGGLYGLVLSLFGSRVLLERLLSMDLDPDERLVFHVGHVVYALTLATWVGSRTDDAD